MRRRKIRCKADAAKNCILNLLWYDHNDLAIKMQDPLFFGYAKTLCRIELDKERSAA